MISSNPPPPSVEQYVDLPEYLSEDPTEEMDANEIKTALQRSRNSGWPQLE